MLKFNLRTTFIALVMTASVAACGGGGGGDGSDVAAPSSPSLSSDIPASALASVDGLIAFMNNLIDTGTNDTSEPILLGESVLPVSDTI